jgi:hypothetical protein
VFSEFLDVFFVSKIGLIWSKLNKIISKFPKNNQFQKTPTKFPQKSQETTNIHNNQLKSLEGERSI